MINKYIKLIFIIFLLSSYKAYGDKSLFVVAKINDIIMTNYDIEKEATYLKLLNPNLSQLSEDKINEIAKNSLINEIIKKDEIKKIFKFEEELDIFNRILKDFYTNLNFENEKEFEKIL